MSTVEIFYGFIYLKTDGSPSKEGEITNRVRLIEPLEVEGKSHRERERKAFKLLADRAGVESSQVFIDGSCLKKRVVKLRRRQRAIANVVFYKVYKEHKKLMDSLMKLSSVDTARFEESREEVIESINMVSDNFENRFKTALLVEKVTSVGIEEIIDEFLVQIDPTQDRLTSLRAKVDIGCPVCKTRLVFVKRLRLETLDEHCYPSDRVSMKDSFGCTNRDCISHQKGFTWTRDGEGPYSKDMFYKGVSYIDNNPAPFRTVQRSIEARKQKTVWDWSTKWFSLVLVRDCKADTNGRIKPFSQYYRFQLFVVGKNGVRVLYQSGVSMLLFSLKGYIQHSQNRVNKFKNHSRRLNWDKRWWYKLSFVIASKMYKREYRETLKG